MATRLGLSLPQMKQYDIGRDIPAVARAAEEIGYESLWVFERILFPEPARQGLYGVPGLPWPDQYRSVADPLVSSPWPPPPPSGPGSARASLSPRCTYRSNWLARWPRWTRPAVAASSRASARDGPTTSTRPPPWPRSKSAARSWTSCSTCSRPCGAPTR